ncbi:hypothetical protein NDI35_00585 [Microcoleus vaginatus FACHB-2002]
MIVLSAPIDSAKKEGGRRKEEEGRRKKEEGRNKKEVQQGSRVQELTNLTDGF